MTIQKVPIKNPNVIVIEVMDAHGMIRNVIKNLANINNNNLNYIIVDYIIY